MVQAQCISRVLTAHDISLFSKYNLDITYFPEYSDEYNFIREHFDNYLNVPDIPTFLEQFPDFEMVEVSESEKYLVSKIREEQLYAKSVPVLKKMAELLKSDANAAAQYMMSELPNLQPNYEVPFVDIIQDATRLEEFKERSEHKDTFVIPTGFQELDEIIGGWETKEELVVVFARTNQGKSWIVAKAMQHAWQIGKNVGYISPEMSANKLAYRFDTLNDNISNSALMRGDTEILSVEKYAEYLKTLRGKENKFIVSTPADFNREITVGKLRTYIASNKLDILAIDGITYMTDERYKRGDNKTTTLTNISEDLMQLSLDIGIPIIVVVQSNRGGVKEDSSATPELEDIRDSDGISHNSTKVLAIKQKEGNLIIAVKKNRYGRVGDKVTYSWNIDTGEFDWIPTVDDTMPVEHKEERKRQIRESVDNGRKVVF